MGSPYGKLHRVGEGTLGDFGTQRDMIVSVQTSSVLPDRLQGLRLFLQRGSKTFPNNSLSLSPALLGGLMLYCFLLAARAMILVWELEER